MGHRAGLVAGLPHHSFRQANRRSRYAKPGVSRRQPDS
ncbi:hypothetical protein I552_2728 [Mycobacterium xenopi 3993]|nr:hypothetical protein I552_2728 [Mycobacterium xenopi 3993]